MTPKPRILVTLQSLIRNSLGVLNPKLGMEGDRAHNWSQARPSRDSRLLMFTPCLPSGKP